MVVVKGNRIYGIDFSGGDVVSIQYKQKLDIGQVRHVATAAGIGEIDPTYVSPLGGGNETLKIEAPEGKAGDMLIVEAGGRIGTLTGADYELGGDIVAGSPKTYEALLALLAPHVPDDLR